MKNPEFSAKRVLFGVSKSRCPWLDYVGCMYSSSKIAIENEIETFQKACLEILKGRVIHTSDLFEDDFIYFSAINRTIEVANGFSDAVKAQNFSVMPVLLRVQINTLATLEFIESNENKREIVQMFNRGTEFRKMKVPGGKVRISESILIKNAEQKYPWIHSVYSKTSSWVHLSPTSTYAPLEISSGRLVTFRVPRLPDPKYQPAVDELCACMKACIDGVLEHIKVWGLPRPPTAQAN